MDKILNLGRYIFPLSFLLYVGLHLGKPDVGASFVPDYLPFPYFWNYFTLICILLFIISAVAGKYDKLSYALMAVYVILMAILVHLPRAMGYESGIENMTGDIMRERTGNGKLFPKYYGDGRIAGICKVCSERQKNNRLTNTKPYFKVGTISFRLFVFTGGEKMQICTTAKPSVPNAIRPGLHGSFGISGFRRARFQVASYLRSRDDRYSCLYHSRR